MATQKNSSSKNSWTTAGCIICKKLITKINPKDPDTNRYCWCGICQRCHYRKTEYGILDHPIIWDDDKYDIIPNENLVVKIKVENTKQRRRRHKKEQDEFNKIARNTFISDQMRGSRNSTYSTERIPRRIK